MARTSTGYRLPAFLVVSLLPPLLVAVVLWVLPQEHLSADRVALAGRDYSNLWAAGHAVATGHASVLFDHANYNAGLRSLFGAGAPEQYWLYPPPVLLLAVPLSALPLLPGFLLYTSVTIVALWLALRIGGLTAGASSIVLLSPAVADNALTGQHGALIGALLLGGLLLVDRRPVLSGILLGALVFKPPLGLLVPLCLAASGNWRTLVIAAVSGCGLVALSVISFGFQIWHGFLVSTQPMITGFLEMPWQGLPSQRIFASPFMAARWLGVSVHFAYGLQSAISLACAIVAWRAWRMHHVVNPSARVALTAVLSLAATPWGHTYDMIPLAGAIVILFRHANVLWRPVLAFAWFWPGAVLLMPIPLPLSVASLAGVAWVAWQQIQKPIEPDRPERFLQRPSLVETGPLAS